MAGPFVELLCSGGEVDHQSTCREVRAVLLAQHRTTASGEDDVALLAQLINDVALAVAKSLFALDVKNGGDGDAGTVLNFMITVEKILPQ